MALIDLLNKGSRTHFQFIKRKHNLISGKYNKVKRSKIPPRNEVVFLSIALKN